MKRWFALILTALCLIAVAGCSRSNEGATAQTGYPAGEVQQPQVMYQGKLYFYFATGFDEPLPQGYEEVGTIQTVDHENTPGKDFQGARVDAGQNVYASSLQDDTIYLQYEKGYAAFTLKK